jgi:AraC family transcriptional regulator, regulatory protein of adaptative response / methylphosphotriester-DNA alkyltransferase methyltransferase
MRNWGNFINNESFKKRMIKETEIPEIASSSQKEIVATYLFELDRHIADLKNGKAESTYKIKDIAALLHIHPTHLSNTIYTVLRKSPCAIYEEKVMAIANELILTTPHSIAEIARHLTFGPSNFTKFFKHFEGITPKQFREANQHKN